MSNPNYDLEERLLNFAVRVVKLTETLPNNSSGQHIAKQLLRSGTSPMAQHAESQAAESRIDFIHKMGIALKELRETRRWMMLVQRIPLIANSDQLQSLIAESDELIRIFATSLKTARAKGS